MPQRKPPRRQYTTEERGAVATLRGEGLSLPKIAAETGIPLSTVQYWCDPSQKEKGLERWRKAFDADPRPHRANVKRYREKNPERIREAKRKWKSTEKGRAQQKRSNASLETKLRVRLSNAVRRGSKAGSAVRDLGCSVGDLRQRLEMLFLPGMSWDNYGEWHIDHKRPLASFDLTDPQQLLQAVNFTNLQPLWATDNCRKGASYAAA